MRSEGCLSSSECARPRARQSKERKLSVGFPTCEKVTFAAPEDERTPMLSPRLPRPLNKICAARNRSEPHVVSYHVEKRVVKS